MQGKIAIIRTTAASRESAKLIAETLVFEKFAACAQIESPIISIYRWRGKSECAEEFPVSIKTSPERLDAAARRLVEIHPYECPQIIASFADASEDYAKWCANPETQAVPDK